MTPERRVGPSAWSLDRRRQRALKIVEQRWRSFPGAFSFVVERELTTNRLLAIRVVSWACGWRDMHRYAVAALSGDERAKRRLRRMLYPQTSQVSPLAPIVID